MTGVQGIREAWSLLEGLEPRDLRVRQLDMGPEAGVRPVLGLDALGIRHLLVPVAADRNVIADRRSSGVQITRHVLIDAGQSRTYVDVVCAKAHLNELFDVVVDEMVGEVLAQPETPDVACRRVLERWRELIEQEVGNHAGPERLAGLFAELWHLRELARLAPDRALDVWVGPQGARHDFLGGAASLEVKATLSRHGRFPEIHSVEQLEPPPGAVLYLAMMKLERVAAVGVTVGRLLEEVADLGVDRHDLTQRAREAGFESTDLAVDHPTRFSVVEDLAYLVDGGFPAITPASFAGGMVPPGVLRVRYLIDLSTDTPAPLDPAAVAEIYPLLLES